MLRLIGLVTLVVIVWLAISGGFLERLAPHVERAVGIAHRVARNLQSDMEARIPDHAVRSDEVVSRPADPYQRLIDEGVVTEEFREKPWVAPEGIGEVEPAVGVEPYEPSADRAGQSKTEQFSDSYAEARRKLLDAMSILEGTDSGT